MALNIIRHAGLELANLALAVVRRLSLGTSTTVAMAGSVLRKNFFVREAFTGRLREVLLTLRVAPSYASPEIGTARLLVKRIQEGVTPEWPYGMGYR